MGPPGRHCMSALRTALWRARTLLWTALSILVILAAVTVGVGKLLMPYTARYQPQLEAWLSREFGREVVLDGFEGEWNAFGPRLRLRGMQLHPPGGGPAEVAIEEAALDLKPFNALVPGRAWYNFLVIGANFRLARNDDGSFELSGLGAGASPRPGSSGGLRHLVGIGEIILENSSLEYEHAARGIRLKLTAIDARVQLDDESASLSLAADLEHDEPGWVYGAVEATALLEFSAAGRVSGARWQLSVRDLLLDPLQGRLPSSRLMPQQGLVNGDIWGDWLAGEPVAVRGTVDLRSGRLGHGAGAILVQQATARFGWIYGGRGDWRVDLHDLRFDDGVAPWAAPNLALARSLAQDVGLWISADVLPLDVSLQLSRDILSLYGTALPAALPETAEGSVSGLDLVLDSRWRMKYARGQTRDAGVRGWGRWPGVHGFDADVAFDGGMGAVEIYARELVIDWPRMFSEVLRFRLPTCRAGVDLEAGWRVSLADCHLFNDDLAVHGDLVISSNEGRPAVDANLAISRGTIERLSRYWPQGIMKPNVVSWLRNGLQAGEIEQGRFQIHGDMDNWPFRSNRGRFEARVRVSGAALDYAPGWPQASGLDAELQFVGASMRVDATAAHVGGAAVKAASARIDDFRRVVVEVDYESDAGLPELIGFLRQSPILGAARETLGRFEFSGPARTRGTIRVPLGQARGQLQVDGRAWVDGGTFADPVSGFMLNGITGQLVYDRAGLTAEGLEARYGQRPASLDIVATASGAERFRATLEGEFDIVEVLPESLRGIDPLTRLSGEAAWHAEVVVPGAGEPWLAVESSLQGVTVDLPEPLRKSAEAAAPIRLRYPLGGAPRLLELDFADDARLRLEIGAGGDARESLGSILRGAIGLGDMIPELPAAGLLRVEGNPRVLDLDGWIDLVTDRARDGSLGDLRLERCTLHAVELQFLDRLFREVGIEISANPADVRASFTSEAIAGHVQLVPGPRGGSLTAEFDRLALDKPVTSGISMRSNPADLPELHLYARSFRYAGIEMGETRIEAYPVPGGFHFEKVEAESDALNLRATGDWLMLDDGPRSDFRILVTTESLGEFLESMSISSSLQGGQTVLRFSAWWPGPPAAFALSRLNGEIEFTVTRGQITNANAGSGRLLGLLSVQALPRRLSLDFRDVFDSGFDFEEAHGTFRMENGTASTDDVELSSSAAKISLRGSTDLVAQRYDQVMTVQPGVGNTLPVLGAIAGGPGGAAAGLALQGLLHDELGEATQVRYTITGSWQEPVIEPILKGAAEQRPVADGP